jgi:hypothetical protein
MVSCMRKGEVMMRLIKVAAAALQHFAEETGQPLGWVHSGSLKVARRTEDAEVIQADIARGRRLGLDVEQITLAEAHRQHVHKESARNTGSPIAWSGMTNQTPVRDRLGGVGWRRGL